MSCSTSNVHLLLWLFLERDGLTTTTRSCATTAENDFEVEVTRTLQKWCVTVYQLPNRDILAQDFFPERWKALARAQDFIRLLNQRNKKENAEAEVEL